MKYLKLALLSLDEKRRSNAVLVLQLIIMFVLVNLMIGSVNSRTMLTDTFESVLDKQGWYVSYAPVYIPGESDPSMNSSEIRRHGMDRLIASMEVVPETVRVRMTDIVMGNGYHIMVSVLSDNIFDDVTLPRTGSSLLTGDRILVFPNKSGITAGKEFTALTTTQHNITLKASGILTDPAYIPRFNSWHIDGDISMLYDKVSSSTDNSAYIIMDETTAARIGLVDEDYPVDFSLIMYFPEEIDEEVFERIQKGFDEDINVAYTPLSVLRQKADDSLAEDLGRYIPLGIVVMIIVLIGTAGAIAIQTLDEMKNFAVYYLCGLKWRETVLISLCKVLMLLAVAGLISGGGMILLQKTSLAASFGLAFNDTNMYISLALVGLTVLSSVALPFILLRRSEPAEIMRRIKND